MLGANYLILSNGDTHLIYAVDQQEKRLTTMKEFPKSN
jgi:hypothetical protein